MNKKSNIIFTDDEDTFRNVMSNELNRMGYRVTCCAGGIETIKNMHERDFDAVILDIRMPDMDGIETLKKIKELEPTTEVIVLTGQGTIENAVLAIRLGAYDYLTKPCRLNKLDMLLQKAIEKRALNKENAHLRKLVREIRSDPFMVGDSMAMTTLYKTINKVAPSDTIVLIQGESGVGKELVAHTIHRRSARADKPFVVVNCATLQETLLESELFGHVKGAFTGATESRTGLFELADGGTLFMDEIGELTVSTQSKLLRVVQSGEIRRVGDNKIIMTDTRIIAATHKNLAMEVKHGKFREDLYFRLNVIPVFVPPLRERKEDIPAMIQYFLQKNSRNKQKKILLPDAMEMMTKYTWPGNVRELENAIERLVILAEGDCISIEDLPENIIGIPLHMNVTDGTEETLSEMEKTHILKILHEKQWNKTYTAKTLGISLKTLYNKLKAYH